MLLLIYVYVLYAIFFELVVLVYSMCEMLARASENNKTGKRVVSMYINMYVCISNHSIDLSSVFFYDSGPPNTFSCCA